MRKIFLFIALFPLALCARTPYVSSVWVADQGDGTYKNPVLHADYSDPDICRVGSDYYMVSSSFNAIPGLPVLHSNDLVNWTVMGYALTRQMPVEKFDKPQHGNGVWAPSIRYRQGEFYIFYGDPDRGIYMVKSKTAKTWDMPVLVKSGKGLIDPCPLWDDDGRVYLVHAFAGSRAGIKSLLAVCELSANARRVIRESVIVYDGHEADPTIEGPKFYKRNGYYYIFAPAGGVPTGWQVALRSENVYGPYERRVVLASGTTAVNGPHQGGWVDTPGGSEDWFMHFQDMGAYGRVVHLQPLKWVNNWPVIGIDDDGDGIGEPVLTHRKPDVGRTYPIATPPESDEFNARTLGLQWQWQANPAPWWLFPHAEKGVLRLYSVPQPDTCKNLWDVPNLLLQKFPAPGFTATAKLTFSPCGKLKNERTGLLIMGLDYALLSLEATPAGGFLLSQNECRNADRGNVEKSNASVALKSGTVYLRVKVEQHATAARCTFSYSTDGETWHPTGKPFTAREGKWIGAKVGLFCSRPTPFNDAGWVDVDWFRVE